AHPKLEVYRAEVGKPLLHPDDDCIVALATDAPLPPAQVPVLMLDDIERIATMLHAEALAPDQIGALSQSSWSDASWRSSATIVSPLTVRGYRLPRPNG